MSQVYSKAWSRILHDHTQESAVSILATILSCSRDALSRYVLLGWRLSRQVTHSKIQPSQFGCGQGQVIIERRLPPQLCTHTLPCSGLLQRLTNQRRLTVSVEIARSDLCRFVLLYRNP